jgi:hypothetical protein
MAMRGGDGATRGGGGGTSAHDLYGKQKSAGQGYGQGVAQGYGGGSTGGSTAQPGFGGEGYNGQAAQAANPRALKEELHLDAASYQKRKRKPRTPPGRTPPGRRGQVQKKNRQWWCLFLCKA